MLSHVSSMGEVSANTQRSPITISKREEADLKGALDQDLFKTFPSRNRSPGSRAGSLSARRISRDALLATSVIPETTVQQVQTLPAWTHTSGASTPGWTTQTQTIPTAQLSQQSLSAVPQASASLLTPRVPDGRMQSPPPLSARQAFSPRQGMSPRQGTLSATLGIPRGRVGQPLQAAPVATSQAGSIQGPGASVQAGSLSVASSYQGSIRAAPMLSGGGPPRGPGLLRSPRGNSLQAPTAVGGASPLPGRSSSLQAAPARGFPVLANTGAPQVGSPA